MRCLVAVLLVVAVWACSGGEEPEESTPDGGSNRPYTTNCPFLGDGDGSFADADSTQTSCWISDWEHDFTCERVEPERIWVCCGYSPTAGVLCQYGQCREELGEPCCDGLQGNPHGYECVDGRWQVPAP